MAPADTIKLQRDRFLAFSFASADLFMEIDENEKISFALGAAKGLTGIDDQTLIGKNWLELFSKSEHKNLEKMKKSAQPALRCGPILVSLNEKITKRKGILTAIKMPGTDSFYVTLGLSNMLTEKLAELMDSSKPKKKAKKAPTEKKDKVVTTGFKATDDEKEEVLTTGFTAEDEEFNDTIYNKEDFVYEAEETFEHARTESIDAAVTVFDFGRTETIPEENWAEMIGQISDFLRDTSINGEAAAEIAEGKYGVIHDINDDATMMEERISAISKELDPSGEGIEITSKTIDADLEELTSQEAARALFYTISEFEKSGVEMTIESLQSSLETHVSANTQKLQEFKSVIERVDFDIHFQPIVDLKTKEAGHYEVLSRFKSGDTQEWIMFGEDVGLAKNFDIAVVERTMNFIHYKAGMTRTKFSINLSGRSIEDPEFFELLKEQLARRDFKNRLMFEITESTKIKNLEKVAKFTSLLQKDGYEIALDDFGEGAASFEYLQRLNVNYVKIDGKYIRRLLKSSRDEVMIRNLVKMCKDLKTKVIAEFVEEQEQADLLLEMKVDYAQGHLFGKAESKPNYVPPLS